MSFKSSNLRPFKFDFIKVCRKVIRRHIWCIELVVLMHLRYMFRFVLNKLSLKVIYDMGRSHDEDTNIRNSIFLVLSYGFILIWIDRDKCFLYNSDTCSPNKTTFSLNSKLLMNPIPVHYKQNY